MDSNIRYRKLTSGVTGELRNLAHSMLVDAGMLPGRKALREMIGDVLPDAGDDVRSAIETKLVELAKKAQEDRGERFTLRGKADDWALEVGARLEAADRIVEGREPEVVDFDAEDLAKSARYANVIGGDYVRERDEAQAAARKRLEEAGLA
jgi:hypothetical protein